MRKILLILLFYLLILQFSCGFGSRIKGQVLDSQNNPVEGAEIKFVVFKGKISESFDSETKATTKTNKNGEFEIPVTEEKPEKTLMLIAFKDGYKLLGIKFESRQIQKYPEIFKDYKLVLGKNE